MSGKKYNIEDLLYLMSRLRDPVDGCPWDLRQTLASIVPYTLEECYELADTIEQGDNGHLREELGDVLFQVVFYCRIASEDTLFDFTDVVHTLVDKLVSRHPHVFPDGSLTARRGDQSISEQEVHASWEAIKQDERNAKSRTGLLADVPLAFPALVRSQKLQKRAATVGFDWDKIEDVLAKIDEELAELREGIALGDKANQFEEVGDLLMSVVNTARHLGVDAESALRQSNLKLEQRFAGIEQLAADQGRQLGDMSLEEMDVLWCQVKASGQTL
ncbi:MAG: nucleoside triphosphate pyrophosphohydrolase [Pseudomonadales bacterium]